jgi:hypothetical protein
MLGGFFLSVSVVELIPGKLEKMRAFQLPVFPVMASLLMGYSLTTLIRKWNELRSLSCYVYIFL